MGFLLWTLRLAYPTSLQALYSKNHIWQEATRAELFKAGLR